ncbi:hypothetical protein [Flavobacterium sp.]|uniref:hypothetical protein n=1 Tax=Flavobacterium sp. TaxID=239 RepID=UPI00286CA230|nr:hypothetical protein [Flavobacterium sp.]
MVTIELKENQYIFNIIGLHQFWALKSKINVPKGDIVKVYQDKNELHKFLGLRVGTYIPFIITAGTYYLRRKTNFWDVSREKNTIIVELQNHRYNKLYIEVKDPEAAITLLNSK